MEFNDNSVNIPFPLEQRFDGEGTLHSLTYNAAPTSVFPTGEASTVAAATVPLPPTGPMENGVSLHEYQRVCANERIAKANAETLKTLVLQLASQLNAAQKEVQLLERSAPLKGPSAAFPANGGGDCPQDASTTAIPSSDLTHSDSLTVDKQLKDAAETRQHLLDVITQKDRIIHSLQQELRAREVRFRATLDSVASEKDAVIVRLAAELDDMKQAGEANRMRRRGGAR